MKIVYENANIPKVISLQLLPQQRALIDFSPFVGISAFSLLQSLWGGISSLSKHVKSPRSNFLIFFLNFIASWKVLF